MQTACRAAIEAGLVASAHDCAEGGVGVALAEAAVTGPRPIGADVSLPPSGRADLGLFGEGPSRIVVTVSTGCERQFEALMAESAIPWTWIGTVGGARLSVQVGGQPIVSLSVARLHDAWRNGFERSLV